MKPNQKPRGTDYKRDPSKDPHLPHTTKFRRHGDLNFPSAALVVMKTRWPELVRTFQQYDHATGMLEVYALTRDAAKAANFPDNMAFLVRDYIIGKLSDQGITVGTNRDKFKMKPEPYESLEEAFVRKAKFITKSGQPRDVDWVAPGKPKDKAKEPPAQESRAQQLVDKLLEADFHSDSEKQVLRQSRSKPLERQIGTIAPEQFARGDAYWTGRRKQGHRRYLSQAIKPLR